MSKTKTIMVMLVVVLGLAFMRAITLPQGGEKLYYRSIHTQIELCKADALRLGGRCILEFDKYGEAGVCLIKK